MLINRENAVAEARTWLGTPFKHQGCLKCVGCDCIGLVKGVGIALGLVNFDPSSDLAKSFANYSMQPDSQRMREGLAIWLVPVPVQDATLADILFMAWGREPQHVALVTDRGIIHSYSTIGRVVEHSLDAQWKHRIVGAYRYPFFLDHT